jgi:hypothetical protein
MYRGESFAANDRSYKEVVVTGETVSARDVMPLN